MDIPDEQEVARVSSLIWERIHAVQALGIQVRGVRAVRRTGGSAGVYRCDFESPLCLIGAVNHPYDTNTGPYYEAARRLGISVEVARLLEEGFEGWPAQTDHPFYKLGEEIELQLDKERFG